MSNGAPKQFNFNSLIGIVCTALVGFALLKLDSLNTSSIKQDSAIAVLTDHVSNVDKKISEMVTRGEYSAGMAERQQEILDLKKQIESILARLPGLTQRGAEGLMNK